jgi:hypothetical protein
MCYHVTIFRCFFSVDSAVMAELNGAPSLPAALKKELDAFLKKAGKAAAGSSLYVARVMCYALSCLSEHSVQL